MAKIQKTFSWVSVPPCLCGERLGDIYFVISEDPQNPRESAAKAGKILRSNP